MSTIILPWPPRQLSPNARVHRQERARLVKEYRTRCGWEAKAQGVRTMAPQPLHLSLTFCEPIRPGKASDMDNMLASLKAGIDGLSVAIGVDDSLYSYTLHRGAPIRDGRVLVEINPAPEVSHIPLRGSIA